MKLISTHVPDEWIKIMDGLVKLGYYASRAEYVRTALLHEFRATRVEFPKKKKVEPLLERIDKILDEAK